MQARILRKELNQFREKAVNIKTNEQYPILTYIKIEIGGITCKIIKNNLKSFVINRFPDTGNEECSFLVLENTLFNFLEHSNSRFIQFEQIRNTIKISDDSSSVESPTERAQEFIDPDFKPTIWAKISRDTLDSIGIVSKIIFPSDVLGGENSNVFIGNGYVAGKDGTIGYYAEMLDKIPNITLTKNIAEIVSKLKYCEFSNDKTYDYFREDLITYGFLSTPFPFNNFTPLFGEIESEYSFKIPKKELVDFCRLCLKTIKTQKESFFASFHSENNSLVLSIEGSDIKIDHDLQLNKKDIGRFRFNPEKMELLLKALTCETVYFYPGENRYFITDSRKSFLSVIMGVK